jgi:hypothetical protein
LLLQNGKHLHNTTRWQTPDREMLLSCVSSMHVRARARLCCHSLHDGQHLQEVLDNLRHTEGSVNNVR